MGLETVEILMDLEDHFGVHIPDSSASACVTVDDLGKVIMNLLVAQGRSPGNLLEREVWDGMVAVMTKNRIPADRIQPAAKWIGDITRWG